MVAGLPDSTQVRGNPPYIEPYEYNKQETLMPLYNWVFNPFKTINDDVPPPDPEPPPPGDWNLLGVPSFNPSDPKFKSGVSITNGSTNVTEFRNMHNGLLWFANNPTEQFSSNTHSQLTSGDLYQLARTVRDRMQSFLIAFRITGDLRMLDVLTAWLKLSKQSMAVGYRDHDTSVVTWSASPYPCWITRGGGQPSNLYGTDHSVMNEIKWHASIAEITYALYLNRNFTSPGGHNYQTEYNFWYNYLVNQFTPKWSGGGSADWRINYRGVRRPPTYSTQSGGNNNATQRYGRAAEGAWPITVNGGDLHSAISQSHLAYYMGLLTGNPNGIAELNWASENFVTDSSQLVAAGSYGQARVWGHGQRGAGGSTSVTAQGATYLPYTIMDMTNMCLEGASPVVNTNLLKELANAVEAFVIIPNVQSNSSNAPIVNVDSCGGVNRGIFVTSYTSLRTQAQLALNPFTVILPFTSGTNIRNTIKTQLDKNASWQGTITQPKNPMYHISLLLDKALNG